MKTLHANSPFTRPIIMALLVFLGLTSRATTSLFAGPRLLVTSLRTGNGEVFIADLATGDMYNVTRAPDSEERYPCWSPDASHIAFISDRNNATNLYTCNADGSNVQQIVHSAAVCYMPSWQKTADGEWIVFGLHGSRPEMARVRPDGSNLETLGVGHDPTLSPDGKFICYTGEVEGGVSVFVMNLDGSNKHRVIRETSRVGATFPNWSPDSKQLVYSFPVGDALELFIADRDGSNNHQVTHLNKVCTPSAWSPDGTWIAFRLTDDRYWSNRERMLKTYAEKPADKRPVWLVHPDGSDAQVIEPLRFQMSIDGSRANWSPKN